MSSTIPACSPTDDPDYWQMDQPCDDNCHHPVHAFGHPERVRHLIDTGTATAWPHEANPVSSRELS